MHGLDPVTERKLFPPGVYERISVFTMNARLVAWAGKEMNNAKLRRRAWAILLQGDDDPREPNFWPIPHPTAASPLHLSTTPRRDSDLGTNNAANTSLNLIACLALAPAELEEVWPHRRLK